MLSTSKGLVPTKKGLRLLRECILTGLTSYLHGVEGAAVSLFHFATISLVHRISLNEDNDSDQHFHYTSGRWLWNAEQQLQDWSKFSHISQLQIIAEAIGSARCESITKLAEGGFNKVFRSYMGDGRTDVSRKCWARVLHDCLRRCDNGVG